MGQVNYDKEQYTYSTETEKKTSGKARLDLNDLLKRSKEERLSDKKNNLLILSGVATVVAVVILLLSL